jgi:LysR family transcriptional activator of glutamate synthase operon
MELRQLMYFVEVARREHVTEAAKRLHVAQSAISRQILNLEKELAVQLFIREGRNLRLTPVGKLFLERVERALLELERAKQEMKDFLDPETGEIRIGFPHSLAAYTLPMIVSAFRKEHPNVTFLLRENTVQQLIEDIKQGEINLALISPVPESHPDVYGHVLFTEELIAILPPNHPLALAKHQTIRLSQLKDDPFVVFRQGYTLRTIVINACKRAGFTPRIAFEGEETDTIRGLVAAGLGVGLLPAIALQEKGPLFPAQARIKEPDVTRTVGFVTPKSRGLSPAEKAFQHFLYQLYKKQ